MQVKARPGAILLSVLSWFGLYFYCVFRNDGAPKLNSEETVKFITLYRHQKFLWRVDSDDYRNKIKEEMDIT